MCMCVSVCVCMCVRVCICTSRETKTIHDNHMQGRYFSTKRPSTHPTPPNTTHPTPHTQPHTTNHHIPLPLTVASPVCYTLHHHALMCPVPVDVPLPAPPAPPPCDLHISGNHLWRSDYCPPLVQGACLGLFREEGVCGVVCVRYRGVWVVRECVGLYRNSNNNSIQERHMLTPYPTPPPLYYIHQYMSLHYLH